MTPAVLPESLDGVIAKLARSEEHFQSLNREIQGYLENCRQLIDLPVKINPNKHIIRLQLTPLPEPDLLISVVIGDCIHNVRSSIDHLWKRLGGSGNFPIYGDTHGPSNWIANKDARLAGIDLNAHAMIDSLQPCHRGKDAPLHPLAVLNKLSNIDKHQTIHLTKPHSTDTQFTFRLKGTDHVVYVVKPPVVFHDEAEVVISDVPAGVVQPGMDVDIQGTLFVALQKSGPWAVRPIQEILRRLIDFVGMAVVAPLSAFVPKDAPSHGASLQ